MINTDPTREQMLAYLTGPQFTSGEEDEVEREAAIYWFCANWHSGQWSNMYSALSQSEYRPGPMCNGPEEDGLEKLMYESLEWEFTNKHQEDN